MNDPHTKRMLYYQRPSFFWLELHVSYDRWVMVQKKHRGGFPVRHFVRKKLLEKGPDGIRTHDFLGESQEP